MLLSYVQIANLALQHIGEDDRIGDPDEDSRPARIVKRAWEPTRLLVLADAHWSFAARTALISARPADPAWPIALNRTAFPLPADLVNLVEILDPDLNDENDEFAVETGPSGAELLAEETGPITIRYIRDGVDIRDPARWSAGFIEAFAFRLAWQISDALAAKTSRKDRAERSYLSALRKAKKANARTKPFRRNPPGDWVRARHRGRTSNLTTAEHPSS
jgi:hypothetical protein